MSEARRVDRTRTLVEELLQDKARSFRSIAREVGCSDWAVRAIWREIAGDSRPMKKARRSRRRADAGSASDDASLAWWVVPVLAVAGIGIALLLRRGPGGAP